MLDSIVYGLRFHPLAVQSQTVMVEMDEERHVCSPDVFFGVARLGALLDNLVEEVRGDGPEKRNGLQGVEAALGRFHKYTGELLNLHFCGPLTCRTLSARACGTCQA